MTLDDPIAGALFSRSRRAVLGLLFTHTDRAFYLREIVDRTGLGVGQVQREVQRLAEPGIIRRFEQGRHVYFQASPDCPVFADLRGIVLRTIGVIPVLRGALDPITDRIDVAFIFGSVARGEATAESDVDLMVIGSASFAQVSDAIRVAERSIGREVNVVVFPQKEVRARLDDRRHVLTSILREAKLFVIGGDDELRAVSGERLDPSA
jgi:predicted nucleotidyltransferase